MTVATDRTWPLPKHPWVMRMTWSELLFAHWPVEPDAAARLLPNGLKLDTRDGKAWVGADRQGRLYRGEIDHQPWTLSAATWNPRRNTMSEPYGFQLTDHPIYSSHDPSLFELGWRRSVSGRVQ